MVEGLRGCVVGAGGRGHSWAAVRGSQGSLRSFLNRPFHTTPTPSTPRNKEEGKEPAREEDECTVNKSRHIEPDLACLRTADVNCSSFCCGKSEPLVSSVT